MTERPVAGRPPAGRVVRTDAAAAGRPGVVAGVETPLQVSVSDATGVPQAVALAASVPPPGAPARGGAATAVAPADEPTADEPMEVAVARVTSAVPGVARLAGGRFGEVAAYLAGRRVTGVRVRDGVVEVHVVVARTADLRAVAADVHRAARAIGAEPVHVFVDDLD